MRRERQLVGAAVVVAGLAAVATVAAPGALATPTEQGPARPGPVEVVEMPIEAAEVTGETVRLRVETRLRHRHNPTPNVTVRVRAVDTDTGLVTTTRTVEVGTLTGESETPATAELTVPREGGYRINAVVYSDDRRVATAGRTVSGVSALRPPRVRSTVRFAERGSLPALSVGVAGVDEGRDRTRLNLTAALTNTGDDPVGDLAVKLVVQQTESNVVAARERTSVGRIRPGRTDETSAVVSVPSEFNYRVDAVLVRDGVVIDSARTVANLNPQRTVDADTTVTEVEFDAGEFTPTPRAERRGADRDRPRATPTPTSAGGPGFGAAVAVAALAILTIATLRRRNR